jgi:hypothetical protein
MQLYLEDGPMFLSVYRGDWVDDQSNGKGALYDHEKQIIICGVFKKGEPDCLLTPLEFQVRYSNGDIYEGFLLKLLRHGKGKMYYANGDRYEGEWRQNRREGQGKMFIEAEQWTIQGLF